MNRKITKLAIAAFLAHRPFCSGNTSVIVDGSNTTTLCLHNNVIAQLDKPTGALSITTAGWNTTTTKARLNGLPGVRVWHAKGEMYLSTPSYPAGFQWDGEWKAV